MNTYEVIMPDRSNEYEYMDASVSSTRSPARLANDVRMVQAERYETKYENGYFVGTFFIRDEPVLTLFRTPDLIRRIDGE